MTDIKKIDVLIIGSGPSGTSTALHLLKSNPEWAGRMILVDKAVHPREKLCGGGITHMGQHILARLGLEIEPQSFKLREVRITYQDKSYSLYGNPIFQIIRRDEFDHWLVKTVEELGVEVRQGEAVVDITNHDDHVEVITEKGTYHAQVVVAADGSRSFVRRKLKWEDDSRVARLVEILTPEDPSTQPEFRDAVAVFDFTYMDDGLQGYYWDFPSYVAGKAYMNRGLFDSRARPERPKANMKQTLRDALDERGKELDNYKLKGHPIRWWSKNGRFAVPRVILVGDAAGADPFFGEGISFALGYGIIASDVINDAFARGDFSFATYRDNLLAHRLFKQLEIRTKLARFSYLLKYPWLFRAGWSVARYFVRYTRWGNPDFDPTMIPSFRLEDTVRSPGQMV